MTTNRMADPFMDPDGEAGLARDARRGDQDAFRRLVQQYERTIHGLAFALTHDHDEAASLAAESFKRAQAVARDERAGTRPAAEKRAPDKPAFREEESWDAAEGRRAAGAGSVFRSPAPPPASPLGAPPPANRLKTPLPTKDQDRKGLPAKAAERKRRGGAWLAVIAILLLIAAGVAVVATGRVAVPDIQLPDVLALIPKPKGEAQAPDTLAMVPPSRPKGSNAVERAALLTSEANRRDTAEAYDEAASAWIQAMPLLEGDPEELAAGRRELASARYYAWSREPTAERRDLAMEAVRSYLLAAPPGAQRDVAWTWLAQLKR